MSCFHPRPAFEYVDGSTGEVVIALWRIPKGYFFLRRSFSVPCQQCSGCRSDYARGWSIRCEHESVFHKENCFLTLTVDPKYLDQIFPGGSLRYEPFQKFIRAFRKRVGRPIRFFMCGEYGEQFQRPHFHAIIFGWFPGVSDRTLYKSTEIGDLFLSRDVSKCWPFGFHTVGNFSRDTAQYVAGYMQKKITGKLASSWYGDREPEFAFMSGRSCPTGLCKKAHGIGGCFYNKFVRDLYDAKDFVTLPGGSKVGVPRYYDKLHTIYHPSHMEKVKVRRQAPDPVRDRESMPDRLAVREVIHKSRLRSKKRGIH